MNFAYRTHIKLMGFILGINGVAMIPPFLSSLYFGEKSLYLPLVLLSVFSMAIGFSLWKILKTSSRTLKSKDAYLLVVTSWVLSIIVGALPYFLSGAIPSFIDAIFQSTAGYTTTGATVVSEGDLPHSLMFWKAITHWLGGLGILIFIASILPLLGFNGQRIATLQTSASVLPKLGGHVKDLNKIVIFIYSSLTAFEFLLLWLGSNMTAFESIINSMGSISTAGLILHPDGVGYYQSVYVEMVISIFSIIGALNILLFLQIIKGSVRELWKNVELKLFLAFILGGTFLVSMNLLAYNHYGSLLNTLHHAFFQVTAFATTSGFSITDYTLWPVFSQFILLILLFIGGCAASTSGGFKIIRFIIMFKLVIRGFVKRIHPRAVSAIKIGPHSVPAPMVSSITAFIPLFLMIFFFSTLILSFQGLNLETTLSTAVSLLTTTGLGFDQLGASGDFSIYSSPLRLFMSLIMLVGRLEVITVLLLFFPSFWNPNRAMLK